MFGFTKIRKQVAAIGFGCVVVVRSDVEVHWLHATKRVHKNRNGAHKEGKERSMGKRTFTSFLSFLIVVFLCWLSVLLLLLQLGISGHLMGPASTSPARESPPVLPLLSQPGCAAPPPKLHLKSPPPPQTPLYLILCYIYPPTYLVIWPICNFYKK